MPGSRSICLEMMKECTRDDGRVDVLKNAELGCCKLCPFSILCQFLFCFDFYFLPLRVLPDPGISSVVVGQPGERLPSRGNDSFIQSQLSGRRHLCPALPCDSPPPATIRACQWPLILTQFLAWLLQRAGTLAAKGQGLGMRGWGEEQSRAVNNRCLPPSGTWAPELSLSRTAYNPASEETKISPIHF